MNATQIHKGLFPNPNRNLNDEKIKKIFQNFDLTDPIDIKLKRVELLFADSGVNKIIDSILLLNELRLLLFYNDRKLNILWCLYNLRVHPTLIGSISFFDFIFFLHLFCCQNQIL